jgi:hypothetical protein
VGLVVDELVPDSPAAKAGLKEYDVLQKLDDQLLVNPEQLATLVRMHKSGEEITLTVIREGKPTEVKVTLAERSVPGMMPFMHPRRGPHRMMGEPGDHQRPHGDLPPGHPPLRQEHSRAFELNGLPKIELQLKGDHPGVVLKDAAGNTLFSRDLDLNFEAGTLPFKVRVQVNKSAEGGPSTKDDNSRGERHPDND